MLTIHLAEAVSQPGLLEVDIVKRIPPKEEPQPASESEFDESDGTALGADGLVVDASELTGRVPFQADSAASHTAAASASQ